MEDKKKMIVDKEELRRQGIPAGVGAPENPDLTKVNRPLSEPEVQKLMAEHAASENASEEDFIKAAMLQEAIGGRQYKQPTPYTDKVRVLDFINTTKPYVREWVTHPKTGEAFVQVSGGDIEFDVMEKFSGFLAHNASMSNLNEKEILVASITLDIAEMAARMACPRDAYTPNVNAQVVNAKHLAMLKLGMNKDGQERQLSTTEITRDHKTVAVEKEPSRMRNLLERIKGNDG
jgi:hypothetical protein